MTIDTMLILKTFLDLFFGMAIPGLFIFVANRYILKNKGEYGVFIIPAIFIIHVHLSNLYHRWNYYLPDFLVLFVGPFLVCCFYYKKSVWAAALWGIFSVLSYFVLNPVAIYTALLTTGI